MSTTFWIIIGGAILTYLARSGGHMVLSRFRRIHPRVEAGLNAVPAAVLTTLVAPAAISAGPAEAAALATAAVIGLRGGGMMTLFVAGAVVLLAGRHLLT